MDKNTAKSSIFDTKAIYIILAVVIFFQVGTVTWRFIFDKEGSHSDEPWSFGLANYYYRPYIYGMEDTTAYKETDDSSDMNRWLDGDILRQYLTVQEDERFSYDSVWYNQAYDSHPPLYYAILHTICSFFPNQFSWWFSYVINIAAMIIGQIFFYKAASEICRSKELGLLAMIMWGFSYGFTNLNIYLRMYSLLTMFSIMFIYYNSRLYYNDGSIRENLIKLGAVTLGGALTHHYFLPAAFGVAACFCFFYLFKKKFKMLFSYAASVGGATALSFVIFPAALYHIFYNKPYFKEPEMRDEYEMPFFSGVRYCIRTLLNTISGLSFPVYSRGEYAFAVTAIVILAAIAVPLAFLFRKEEWFKTFTKNVQNKLLYFFRNFDFIFLFLIIGSLFLISVIAKTVNIHITRERTDRYLFVIAPWAVLCMILTVKYIIRIIRPLKKHSAKIISVLVCASIVVSNILTEKLYLFERYIYGSGGLETTVSDSSSYIVLLPYKWHMVLYPDKLIGCNKALFTLFYEFDQYEDEIRQTDPDSCYVVMNSSIMLSQYFYWENVKDDDGNEASENSFYDDSEIPRSYAIDSMEDVFAEFETKIFPGYKLQFYSAESIMGSTIKTYKVVPESEYEYIYGTDAAE